MYTGFILGNRDVIFMNMDAKKPADREFYSSSLTRLQSEFVLGRIKDMPNVKNLIRLVKYRRQVR